MNPGEERALAEERFPGEERPNVVKGPGKNSTRDFPAFLRDRLKKYGINQKELAYRIGKSVAYVNHWTTGVKPPPAPEVMRKIVESIERISPEDEEKLMQFAAERDKSQLFILGSKLLRSLLERIPKPGHTWSEAEQDAWLLAAKGIFKLEYPPSNHSK